VILVYERDQEKLSADEGWAQEMGIAFHDHFVVVGQVLAPLLHTPILTLSSCRPLSNPAGIKLGDSPAVAFKKIAEAGAPFHSRADGSATMVKERHIWSQLNLSPWTTTPPWYTQTTLTPADALVKAGAAGAYLLSDRSTLLRQTQLGTIKASTVFYEPSSSTDFLMNSCAAMVSDQPSDMALRFARWLLSDKAQSM
jgi:tungstate transport system substrate-binding protein